MKKLILALSGANLSNEDIESVLTEFEVWIDSKVQRREEKLMLETITPIQRETDGIRTEIRFLAETMRQGFALMDERFQKADQKLDFTRKHLELQTVSTRENLETQIKANERQLGLVQKLLWLVLTLVLGLFAKAIHLF